MKRDLSWLKSAGVLVLVFLSLTLVFVVDWHFPKVGFSHRSPNMYERLYGEIANVNKLPEFCLRISEKAHLASVFTGKGMQVSSTRSNCFRSLAINHKELAFCESVAPLSTWFFDGSGLDAEHCRARVSPGAFVGVDGIRFEEMEPLLDEMGIDFLQDPLYQRSLALYGEDEFGVMGDYWNTVIRTKDFIERAGRLPSEA